VKVEFRSSFVRDLNSVRDKAILRRVREIIERAEQTKSSTEIPNLKRLKGSGNYSRIRVGEYRIGVVLKGDDITFVRFLHRREIYRYFP